MFLLRICCLCALVGSLSAAEALPSAADLAPELRDELRVVVRVNDPAWLAQHTGALAQAIGPFGALVMQAVNEFFYFHSSGAGIDLTRPAVVAWREGDAPLVMMIPVGDRRAFLADFAKVSLIDDRMMLRVDEQQGAFVYSHASLTGGMARYRLLLRNGYACLARSVEECEQLAAALPAAGASAVHIELDGDQIAEVFTDHMEESTDEADVPLGAFPLLTRKLQRLPGAIQQLARFALRIGPSGSEGDVEIVADAYARPDSTLAAWIARQQNSGSRLLPLVRRPGDLFTAYGHLRYQGEIEAIGREIVQRLRESETELSVEQAQGIRAFTRLDERGGAFAWAMSMDPQTKTTLLRAVFDQPKGVEHLKLVHELRDLLYDDDSSEYGGIASIGGLPAFTATQSMDNEKPVTSIRAASAERQLAVLGNDEARATIEARTMAAALSEDHAPVGEPGIFVLQLHIDEFMRKQAEAAGAMADQIEELSIDVVLRVDEGRGITGRCVLPFARFQELVSRSPVTVEPERPPPRDR